MSSNSKGINTGYYIPMIDYIQKFKGLNKICAYGKTAFMYILCIYGYIHIDVSYIYLYVKNMMMSKGARCSMCTMWVHTTPHHSQAIIVSERRAGDWDQIQLQIESNRMMLTSSYYDHLVWAEPKGQRVHTICWEEHLLWGQASCVLNHFS